MAKTTPKRITSFAELEYENHYLVVRNGKEQYKVRLIKPTNMLEEHTSLVFNAIIIDGNYRGAIFRLTPIHMGRNHLAEQVEKETYLTPIYVLPIEETEDA